MGLYDYAGIIHFHSAYSFDGHVALDKIIKAAADNGLDFLMLTDHDHLRAKEEGREGWNGKVLLVVGQEIAPRFNHYLAFNLKNPIVSPEDVLGILPQKYIDAVNSSGGFGFIAHPDHEGTKTFHVKHYPWMDWSVEGYVGISIWDFMTDWQSSLKGYLPSVLSYFFPAFFLRGPRKITLDRWDALNREKKIVGIGESDNHASIKKVWGIRIEAFPFDTAFKFIRTHILTEEALTGDNHRDISLLYSSLCLGRCYAAMEFFYSSRGFEFVISQADREYYMGDSLPFSNNTQIKVTLPRLALIRVIRNGVLMTEKKGTGLTLPVMEAGVYRSEVFIKAYGKYRPWIFSNPIYVK